jgi:hypothetical protein
MTARDEAIEAMQSICCIPSFDMTGKHVAVPLKAIWCELMLVAIPIDVLARLAIERGGLVETDGTEVFTADDGFPAIGSTYRLEAMDQ